MDWWKNAAGDALRQVRALYATGTTGGLTDGRLVERFLNRDGLDREDALAGDDFEVPSPMCIPSTL